MLLFADDPTIWFPSAKIEVVQFAYDGSGDILDEQSFTGSLIDQVRACLNYLQSTSITRLEKQSDQFQIKKFVNYPIVAMRESLVNAVYHRSYQPHVLEPTKVYVYPDRIEFISYPGPVLGVIAEHFEPNSNAPPMPARNRRIGEFLKELGLAEGRLTGVTKIHRSLIDNGSPPPRFDFDEFNSYFRTTLYAHPKFSEIIALRDVSLMRVLDDHSRAKTRLFSAWSTNPNSILLTRELIRQYLRDREIFKAEGVFDSFKKTANQSDMAIVADAYRKALIEVGEAEKARGVTDKIPLKP